MMFDKLELIEIATVLKDIGDKLVIHDNEEVTAGLSRLQQQLIRLSNLLKNVAKRIEENANQP